MSIDEIESFFENKQKNFFDYKTNIMLKSAIDRNLEIIGKAINRIITRDLLFIEKITTAKAIVVLRNQVIRAYDGVFDENIWSILTNHLPKLKIEIENLIKPELEILPTNSLKKLGFRS